MRLPHWITPVLSLMLAAATGPSAVAQSGPWDGGGPPPAGYYGGSDSAILEAGGMAYPPPVSGQGPYGPMPFAAPPRMPGAMPPPPAPPLYAPPTAPQAPPPGALPWPKITPFEHSFSEHRVGEKGLWWWDANNRDREWFFRAEYINTSFKKPHGPVGNGSVQTYLDRIAPIVSQEPFDDQQGGGGQNALGLQDVFDLFAGNQETPFSQFGFFPAISTPGAGGGYNYFDAVSASRLDDITSGGFRVSIGFMNADDTGLIVDAFYTGQGRDVFSFRNEFLQFRQREGQIAPSLTDHLLESFTESVRAPAGRFGPQGIVAEFDAPPGTPIPVLINPLLIDPLQQVISPFTGDLQGAGGVGGGPFLATNLFNLGGLPVDDGTVRVLEDGTVLGGTTIPYDLEFRLENVQESAGTAVTFLLSSFIKKEHVHVRPIVSGRFLHIQEKFRFYGRDSGLTYDNLDADDPIFPLVKLQSIPDYVDDNNDGVIDPAGAPEDLLGGTGGQAAAGNTRFTPLVVVADALGLYHPGAYEAFLNNEAESFMGGPEIGLMYDVGGEKFKIRGHTKVGLFGVYERINMIGNNIGEANNIGNNFTIPDANGVFEIVEDGSTFYLQNSPLLEPTVTNPFPNAFTDYENHTHVTPVFEQSFQGELAVFGYIPVLRRISYLRDAVLTTGITFTWVGEVVRPNQSILWQGNPRAGLFPSIAVGRDSWFMYNWNVGVQVPF